MLEAIQSIDPAFIIAVPAMLWQGWYNQRRRDSLARAEAMRRHPSARR